MFAGFAVAYAVLTPVGSSPDELSHLNYARLIADHAQLPPETVREHQQPPLFYLLAAGLLRAGAAPVWLRLLSVVLGASGVVAIALIARVVTPGRAWLAAASAALLAALPGYQFVAGSITDDALAIAMGMWILLVAVLVLRAPEPTTRLLVAIGAVLGLALLAKQTDWAPMLALVAAVIWHWRPHLRWRHAFALLGLPLLISGWWYARNLATFHSLLPPLVVTRRVLTPHLVRAFVSQTVRSIFRPERYQGGLLTLPRAAGRLEEVLVAVLVVLLLVAAYLLVRRWRVLSGRQQAMATCLTVAAVLGGIASVGNGLVVTFQPQGRYLLTAAAAPILALAAVFAFASGRAKALAWPAAGAVGAACAALSVIGLHTSLVAYG